MIWKYVDKRRCDSHWEEMKPNLVISLHHKTWFHSRSSTFSCITSLPALNLNHIYFIKKKGALWFIFLFMPSEELAQISVQNGFLLLLCILDYLNFVVLHGGKLGTEYAFQAFCLLKWYSNQKEYHFFLFNLRLQICRKCIYK